MGAWVLGGVLHGAVVGGRMVDGTAVGECVKFA